jgi:hypothetical protein
MTYPTRKRSPRLQHGGRKERAQAKADALLRPWREAAAGFEGAVAEVVKNFKFLAEAIGQFAEHTLRTFRPFFLAVAGDPEGAAKAALESGLLGEAPVPDWRPDHPIAEDDAACRGP